MILTCPNCDTRYSVDGSRFPPQGRTVRCAKCGHSWHQPAEPAPVPRDQDVEADIASAPAPSAARTFGAAPPAPRPPLAPRLGLAVGWLGLIAVVALLAAGAVRYRQDIVTIWPRSAALYTRLGLAVNASGLDLRQVASRHETVDGQTVLVVTGQIVNTAARELPVPQTLVVTLSDGDHRELYHWTFAPGVTVLQPGQSAPFLTRLSSPPAATRTMDVRFVKDPS